MKKIYITADQIETISCNKSEQETAINWLRDDDIAVICTSDLTMVTKLAKCLEKDPDNYRCYYYEENRDPETGKLGNYFFECPKNLVSFRAQRQTKPISEERRKAASDRLKKARAARYS